jgi:hypothetical protein
MEKLGIDATHSFKKTEGLDPGSDQGSKPKAVKPPNAKEKTQAPINKTQAPINKAVGQTTEHNFEEQFFDHLDATQLSEVPCAEVKPKLPEGYVPVAPEHGAAERTSPTIGMNLGKFSLRYLATSAKREFVFAVGQHVNLEPLLHSTDENSPATEQQKDCLTYSVSPPLPDGLELDPKTGIISGIVADSSTYGGSIEHAIKVGVRVLAAWNKMVLGSLTLCEVRIKVRVVDLMSIQHQIRWIKSGVNDTLQIEFNDAQCFDDAAWPPRKFDSGIRIQV